MGTPIPAVVMYIPVSFAVFHNLCIATNDVNSGPLGSIGHRADFGLQNIRPQPRFENIRDYQ